MQKSVILFDFDGTIANTLDAIIGIMNSLADEFGFRKIKEEDVEYLRNKRPHEILKYLRISLYKLPFVIRKARKQINSHIATLHPAVDLLPILKVLSENGCQLIILTTNSQDNVRKFLYANNLSDLFDCIYTARKVFGKDRTISKIIRQNNLDKSNVYFVCDEVRDIQAGKKSKITTIAVSWGYNTKSVLLKEKPDYTIDLPSELEGIILS